MGHVQSGLQLRDALDEARCVIFGVVNHLSGTAAGAGHRAVWLEERLDTFDAS